MSTTCFGENPSEFNPFPLPKANNHDIPIPTGCNPWEFKVKALQASWLLVAKEGRSGLWGHRPRLTGRKRNLRTILPPDKRTAYISAVFGRIRRA
ncbi:hypothetical protein [Rhodonellum ikkaensis]|uniref:hypothetical protein n=1 Tax=Rhodonellum ikkaensis TaxID=336829 RepID=UPI001114365F|nr:hypothetical protein [Rhodonellum ikkaensis]